MPTERDGATARPWRVYLAGITRRDGRDPQHAYVVETPYVEGTDLDKQRKFVEAAVSSHDALIEKLRALAEKWEKQAGDEPLETIRDPYEQGFKVKALACAQELRALGDGR